MRKLAVLASALLILAACSAVPAAELTPAHSTASDVYRDSRPEKLAYQVETRLWDDSVQTEDGTVLAWYRFHLPEMTVLREDGTALETADTAQEQQALEAAAAFNERFSGWIAPEDFENMAREAAAELEAFQNSGTDWYGGYSQELEISLYQTEHLVSIQGTYSSYAGGPHPNRWHMGWSFDLDSGTFFGPESLAADSADFQQAVLDELIRQADNRAAEYGMEPQDLFWEDYQDILSNWSSYAVFFDENGMVVAFSPYELASYAAGSQAFRLSYDWLLPHLSEHGCQVLELESE